jgi:hypothetical protein
MKKGAKDALIATIVVIFIFVSGFAIGEKYGFDRGVEVNHGDKWDCAYSYNTGFLMCYRTPKYK